MKNPLDELSEQLQNHIVEWAREIPERTMVTMIQKKPEEGGLGIPVSRSGLNAFLQRKRREKAVSDADQLTSLAKELTSKEPSEGKRLEEATLALLRQKVLDKATEEMSAEDLLKFYEKVERAQGKREQRELDKKKSEEFMKLCRDRLQLNAAKLALEHAEDLRGLITQGEAADGEKLQGMLGRLLGEKFAKPVEGKKGMLTEGNEENEGDDGGK